MKPYYILIFLLSITGFNCTYPMIREFKYKPIIQPAYCQMVRDIITDWTNDEIPTTTIKQIITIKREATPEEQLGTCIRYAINTITNSTAPIKLYDNATSNIDITKFFEQTDHPEKNDLVVYTKSKNSRKIKHFAIVVGDTTYESKWGTHKEIIQHALFAIPTEHGKVASFWTLKKEFTYPEGQEKLPKMIAEDVTLFENKVIEKYFAKQRTYEIKINLGKIIIVLQIDKK